MRKSMPLLVLPLVLALVGPQARADSCDTIRLDIETKLRSSGVVSYALLTVDINEALPGKVVGSCGLGKKKIVYQAQGASAAALPASASSQGSVVSTLQGGAQGVRPGTVVTTTQSAPKGTPVPKPDAEGVITECRDGSMSVGGVCKK